MNAEIIAVGSEMLTPSRVDTNSLWLTDQLNAMGVEVAQKAVVGDHRGRLAGAIREALGRSELVILSGGLGPTEDDLTREAVADATGRVLALNDTVLEAIATRFARLGRTMAEINKRQAYILAGAEVLPNPRGTAPGQWLELPEGRVVLLLPGPPGELKPLFENEALPRLRRLVPPLAIATLEFRVAGMPESDLDQLISPVYRRYENPVTTVLAKPGDIQVIFRARCATREEAERLVREMGDQVRPLLGDRVYSENGDPLEKVIGEMLLARAATLVVAESCTGGLLGARLTEVAGSSAWFRGGRIVYSMDEKRALIGDFTEDPVSEAVARRLAVCARERSGSTFALSITGVAGPDGGTEANPVGTVWIVLAGPGVVMARRFRFPGERARVRGFAVQNALEMLRRQMCEPVR
jgi:nicotinamide-nucleotide amidase